MERGEVDPQDRVSREGQEGLLGSAGLLELRGTVVQRSVRDVGGATEPAAMVPAARSPAQLGGAGADRDRRWQRLRRVCVGGCQMWSARRLQGSRESLVPANG